MSLGEKIRELDEQVADAVRRAVEDLRAEMRRRLDEATLDLQRRLGEVAPELPRSFVDEDHLRRIAEEAAAPTGEALEAARDEGRARGREEGRGEARREAHEALLAALSEVDRARGQADLLQRLLDGTGPYARRAAILLVRDGRLAGWGARGFESDPEVVRTLSLPGDEAPWSTVVGGGAATTVPGAGTAPLVSQLDSALPKEGCLVPLVLRDRVAAILYADRAEDSDPLDLPALQVLTYGAALALETLALRQREATSTLFPSEPGEAAAPVAAPVAVEEPPPAPAPAEPETPEEYELTEEPGLEEEEIAVAIETDETETAPDVDLAEEAATPVETEAPTFEIETTPEPVPEEPEMEVASEESLDAGLDEPEALATPPHGDDLLTRRYDYLQEVEEADARAAASSATEAVDESAFEEAAFEEAPELEVPETPAEGTAPTTEEPSAPIPWRTETQETTAVTPPSGEGVGEEADEPEVYELVEEPDAEATSVESTEPVEEELEERPEAGAVPPPPPTPATAGAVEPPADVEGPGWAFSAAREPVAEHEEAAHEEARRLARLLVSEIQLYNQDEVEEGRRNRDIYERLRDDIDRSRQLYEERVDPGVRETTDYFYQELVRQLAAGDAKALGI